MVTPKQVEEISSFFPLKVLRATGDNPQCEVALVRIAKSLHDLFRFFEPAFFKGKLFVSKHFNDEFVFEKGSGVLLLDKNPLLERFDGNLFIQVLNDGKAYLWEDQDEASISNRDDILTYFYEANREYFLVSNQKIDFTQYPYGSMFAPQFYFLDEAFREFEVEKISVSSCPIFSKVWHRPPNGNKDPFDNRVLFQGGGSGSGIPEKHMQDSFETFLKSHPNFRGIEMEVNREFNVDANKPKPVDFRVTWLEANRIALVELKWTGSSVSEAGQLNSHDHPRVNVGLEQLKGYWDSSRADFPRKLMKAFLLVFDARRRNVTESSVEVSFDDGLYYKEKEFEIQADRRYYDEIVGFEAPKRMFAEPKCKIV